MILSQLAPHRLAVAPEAPLPLAGLLEEVAAAAAAAEGDTAAAASIEALASSAAAADTRGASSSGGSIGSRAAAAAAAAAVDAAVAGGTADGWELRPGEAEAEGVRDVSSFQVGGCAGPAREAREACVCRACAVCVHACAALPADTHTHTHTDVHMHALQDLGSLDGMYEEEGMGTDDSSSTSACRRLQWCGCASVHGFCSVWGLMCVCLVNACHATHALTLHRRRLRARARPRPRPQLAARATAAGCWSCAACWRSCGTATARPSRR
jgi:hypothetical protein